MIQKKDVEHGNVRAQVYRAENDPLRKRNYIYNPQCDLLQHISIY